MSVEGSGAVGPGGQGQAARQVVGEAGAERDRLAAAARVLSETAREDNSPQVYRRSASAYARETAARIANARTFDAAGADRAAVQAAKDEAVIAAARAKGQEMRARIANPDLRRLPQETRAPEQLDQAAAAGRLEAMRTAQDAVSPRGARPHAGEVRGRGRRHGAVGAHRSGGGPLQPRPHHHHHCKAPPTCARGHPSSGTGRRGRRPRSGPGRMRSAQGNGGVAQPVWSYAEESRVAAVGPSARHHLQGWWQHPSSRRAVR